MEDPYEVDLRETCQAIRKGTANARELRRLFDLTVDAGIQGAKDKSPQELCLALESRSWGGRRTFRNGERNPPTSEEFEGKKKNTRGPYWSMLHPDMRRVIMRILVGDPVALRNLCISSKETLEMCKTTTFWDDSVHPDLAQERTFWEYLLNFRGERDVKKCLLYGWVWFLLMTNYSHWLRDDPPSHRSWFHKKFVDLRRSNEMVLSDRWLVARGTRSVLDLVPFESVSRNDLLLFSSTTYPAIEHNTVFRRMMEDNSVPVFWRTVNRADLLKHFGLPQRVEIADIDQRPDPKEFVTFDHRRVYLAKSAEDFAALEDGDVAVPLYGTDTRVRNVQVLFPFTHGSFESLLPEVDVNGLNERQFYDALIAPEFRGAVEGSLLMEVIAWNEPPILDLCERVDFFETFDVALYAIPYQRYRGWEFELVGAVVPRASDVSPAGVDYWR